MILLMARSGGKYSEVWEYMGTVLQDFGVGEVRPPDLWHFLQGYILGYPIFWLGELFDDSQYMDYPQNTLPQGGPLSGINEPVREMVGRWQYPHLGAAMEAVGLEEVDTYFLSCRNNVAHYIATRQILELCLSEERRSGSQV